MKKKITAALACAIIVLSLAGCSKNEGTPESSPNSSNTESSSKGERSSEDVNSSDESKPSESDPDESKPESSSGENSKDSSTESTPESKPEEQQPVDPIDWSTVPYADELDFIVVDYKDGVKINEYRGKETILKIPETINGKKVLLLEALIFPSNIKGLSIPNSVTIIPSVLINPLAYDFQSVVLPDKYYTVNAPKFLDLSKEAYTDDKTVFTYLGNTYQMPEDFIKLHDALYPGTGKILVSKDGKLKKVSIAIKDVVIPDNVTSIEEGAFSNCDLIEDITIPGKITEIHGNKDAIPFLAIFYRCPNLKSVTFAEGVTKIDGYIFNICPKLETITLPDTLTHLDKDSLSGIPKQAQVTYKGVTYKSNQLDSLYKAVNGN